MKKDLLKLYQDKKDQVEKGAELLVAKTRDWQVIVAYLNNRFNEIDLTPEQEEKLKRYQYIWTELSSGKYGESDVVTQVMNIFKVKLTQAYEDLNCTKEIWTRVLNIKKRFEQKLQLETAKRFMHKCEELQDFKNATAAQKNIIQLLRDIEDDEENPAELFKGHIIEAVVDPKLIGAPKVDRKAVLAAINEKRSKKIGMEIFEDLITDIDHEEVKE